MYLEAKLITQDGLPTQFDKHSHFINGLTQHYLNVQSHIPMDHSHMCRLINNNDSVQEIVFDDFSPGSIIIFE